MYLLTEIVRSSAPVPTHTVQRFLGDRILLSALSGIVALLTIVIFSACSVMPVLPGNPLDPPRPAMPFDLENQYGQRVSLQEFEGHVVVLTFLYTSCPDVCPLVANKLSRAHEILGDTASNIAFVGITVDPEQDTPERMHVYSAKWRMSDLGTQWQFLTGARSELEPLWKYYWVGEVVPENKRGTESTPNPDQQEYTTSGQTGNKPPGFRLLIHGTPVFVIDQSGDIRTVFSSTFTPAELASALEILSS